MASWKEQVKDFIWEKSQQGLDAVGLDGETRGGIWENATTGNLIIVLLVILVVYLLTGESERGQEDGGDKDDGHDPTPDRSLLFPKQSGPQTELLSEVLVRLTEIEQAAGG